MRVKTNFELLKARKESNILKELTPDIQISCIVNYIYDIEFNRVDSIKVNLKLDELEEICRIFKKQNKVTEVEKALGKSSKDIIITDEDYGVIIEIKDLVPIHNKLV